MTKLRKETNRPDLERATREFETQNLVRTVRVNSVAITLVCVLAMALGSLLTGLALW